VNETETPAGSRIIRATWGGTGLFVVMASAAAVAPDAMGTRAAVVDGALFVVGCIAFLLAYGRAIRRSGSEQLSVTGVYFLSGSAPAAVKRSLLGALAVQVVMAAVTASVRPYTSLAFGILVPVFGLGMTGLWGARYGEFPERQPSPAARTGRRGR